MLNLLQKSKRLEKLHYKSIAEYKGCICVLMFYLNLCVSCFYSQGVCFIIVLYRVTLILFFVFTFACILCFCFLKSQL